MCISPYTIISTYACVYTYMNPLTRKNTVNYSNKYSLLTTSCTRTRLHVLKTFMHEHLAASQSADGVFPQTSPIHSVKEP